MSRSHRPWSFTTESGQIRGGAIAAQSGVDEAPAKRGRSHKLYTPWFRQRPSRNGIVRDRWLDGEAILMLAQDHTDLDKGDQAEPKLQTAKALFNGCARRVPDIEGVAIICRVSKSLSFWSMDEQGEQGDYVLRAQLPNLARRNQGTAQHYSDTRPSPTTDFPYDSLDQPETNERERIKLEEKRQRIVEGIQSNLPITMVALQGTISL